MIIVRPERITVLGSAVNVHRGPYTDSPIDAYKHGTMGNSYERAVPKVPADADPYTHEGREQIAAHVCDVLGAFLNSDSPGKAGHAEWERFAAVALRTYQDFAALAVDPHPVVDMRANVIAQGRVSYTYNDKTIHHSVRARVPFNITLPQLANVLAQRAANEANRHEKTVDWNTVQVEVHGNPFDLGEFVGDGMTRAAAYLGADDLPEYPAASPDESIVGVSLGAAFIVQSGTGPARVVHFNPYYLGIEESDLRTALEGMTD